MNNEQLRKLLDNNKLDVDNALRTITKFQRGKLKPLVTSMEHYNSASLGGIIPGLTTSIGARPAHGKCLRFGTKILMYNGDFKEVQDVVEGDKLMGVDSTPRTVLSLARGQEEMYWIRQNKGIDYCVNKSHILSLKKSRQEGSGDRGDILNISVEEYLKKSDKFKSNYKGYKIDVEFNEQNLEIDPYYLGLWLGDGAKNNIRYIYNPDTEIINYIKSLGGQQSEADNLRLMLPKDKYISEFKSIYKLRKSISLVEKYIPEQYLINSKNNRLRLLAGLLDSDGYYSSSDNTFEIIQKNKKLAEQIVFLCNSLGFRVTLAEKIATIKSTGFEGLYYRISIYGNLEIIPNIIERKKARSTSTRRDWRNTGIKVEFDKIDDYYGFELDGDRLFLLEDMTVTHNTYTLHQIKNDVMKDDKVKSKMLLYNWEMPWFSLILIELKKLLKVSFKEILMNSPTKDQAKIYEEVMENMRDDRMTTISKALTPDQWDLVTRMWIEENLDQDLLVIGTDHLGITVGDDKTKTIYQFMERQNAIKLDYPNKVAFLNLFQLKREIEAIWRANKVNPSALRVTSEYLFGADAMMQYSDIIFAQVIPDRANLELYTAVHKERYKHLQDHFAEDKNPMSEYIQLKGENRIYFDYIKKRLPEDGEPTLYCEILSKEREEFITATAEKEKDYTQDDEDDVDF